MNAQAPALADPSAPAKTGPRAHLLGDRTAHDFRQRVAEGVERVAGRLGQVDRPFTGVTPAQLEDAIASIDLQQPLADPTAALDELERIYLRDAVYFHHPRYLAHLNCPVAIPALVAEAILSSVNSSLDTWDQSAGATLIERRLIAWTAERLGLGGAADGIFTSGGTQSNLQALLIARHEATRHEATSREATEPGRFRILASQVSHFSITKAADLLGLGTDAVIPVRCDDHWRMDTAALTRELDRCRRAGLPVMAVVATAGTTDFGSIDPLVEIARLCEREGLWMHVDAAYGCGLLVSSRRRLLDGIDRADSVTVDYHKSFFQPVSSSAVIVRDGRTLRHVTYHADYLNPRQDSNAPFPNQVDKSIQTTRRFDALKLWLTLRIMGPDTIGELFDDVVDRAMDAWRMLDADPRFEVAARPVLSTLVFRYVPPGGADPATCDRANLHAREALLSSGEALVAATTVNGRHFLKFTLLNPETSLRDIAYVLELIADHAGATR